MSEGGSNIFAMVSCLSMEALLLVPKHLSGSGQPVDVVAWSSANSRRPYYSTPQSQSFALSASARISRQTTSQTAEIVLVHLSFAFDPHPSPNTISTTIIPKSTPSPTPAPSFAYCKSRSSSTHTLCSLILFIPHSRSLTLPTSVLSS
jgi:hypothetical protein